MIRSSYGRALAAILAAGFLARLGIAVWIPTRPVSDFWAYFRSAENLAQTGRYELAPGIPNHGHPPAYPIVISAALRLASPAGRLFSVKLVNAGLGCLAAGLAAALARMLWGEAAGLFAAAGLAFFPRSLLMADLVASENLFSPLLMLFLLLCSASWTRDHSPGLAAGIGLVVGALALTRSVAYFLAVVWVFGALAARFPRGMLARGLVLLLVAQHALMLPWAIRNARVLGRFTFLNNVGGVGLFIGNSPDATGRWRPWRPELERLRPGILARGPVAIDDAARQEAWRWIQANPGHAAALYARKLGIVLTAEDEVAAFSILAGGVSPPQPAIDVLPGSHPLKSHARAVRFLLRAAELLLGIAGLGGFLVLAGRARAGSVPDRALAAGFAAAALYVPIVSAAIAVSSRYRWPSEDVITPLAGFCLARMTVPTPPGESSGSPQARAGTAPAKTS